MQFQSKPEEKKWFNEYNGGCNYKNKNPIFVEKMYFEGISFPCIYWP